MGVRLGSAEWSVSSISRTLEKNNCILDKKKQAPSALSTSHYKLDSVCTVGALTRATQKFGLYFFTSTIRW